MKKRIAAVVMLVIGVLLLTPLMAFGLNTAPSTLTVIVNYAENDKDVPAAGIRVSVCRVAEAQEGVGGIQFSAVSAFAAAGADFSDMTASKNAASSFPSLATFFNFSIAPYTMFSATSFLPSHIATFMHFATTRLLYFESGNIVLLSACFLLLISFFLSSKIGIRDSGFVFLRIPVSEYRIPFYAFFAFAP